MARFEARGVRTLHAMAGLAALALPLDAGHERITPIYRKVTLDLDTRRQRGEGKAVVVVVEGGEYKQNAATHTTRPRPLVDAPPPQMLLLLLLLTLCWCCYE